MGFPDYRKFKVDLHERSVASVTSLEALKASSPADTGLASHGAETGGCRFSSHAADYGCGRLGWGEPASRDDHPQRGCSSRLMPSAVLATTSCVRNEFAGCMRPRRASRSSRSYPRERKIPAPPLTSRPISTTRHEPSTAR